MSADGRWQPDNADGSGWAEVDWTSAARGSRYHYRHVPKSEKESRPPYYLVKTRLESPELQAPHENSYFISRDRLADLIMELTFSGGDEGIWHIEPCNSPPPESGLFE